MQEYSHRKTRGSSLARSGCAAKGAAVGNTALGTLQNAGHVESVFCALSSNLVATDSNSERIAQSEGLIPTAAVFV